MTMKLREWWKGLKKQPTQTRPVEVVVSIGVRLQQEDPQITEARKAATAHAKAGNYGAAVAELDRVREFQTSDGSPADCSSEIRRAKYLQKAGRGDEAWQHFQNLFRRHKQDAWLLVDLLDAMRLHLQRENKAGDAICYGVAMRLAQVKLYRDWRHDAEAKLAGPIECYGDLNLERLIRENHERDIQLCDKWLGQLTDPNALTALAKSLCKKAGIPDQTAKLTERFSAEIERGTSPLNYLETSAQVAA